LRCLSRSNEKGMEPDYMEAAAEMGVALSPAEEVSAARGCCRAKPVAPEPALVAS